MPRSTVNVRLNLDVSASGHVHLYDGYGEDLLVIAPEKVVKQMVDDVTADYGRDPDEMIKFANMIIKAANKLKGITK